MPVIEMDLSPIKKPAVCPKVSVMVNVAITTLAGPKGSSLQAINKYIGENYNADVQKLSSYIKKYLKSSVESGEIVQTSGKGARGSFKINKQKVAKETNNSKVKQSKVRTSTPEKTLKPKKAFTLKSPIKKMKLPDDEEIPIDSALTISEAKKTKKPPRVPVPTKTKKSKTSLCTKIENIKKITAKILDEPDTSVSPKEKPENGMVSSGDVKAEDAPNSEDTKKPFAPEKSTETKTNFTNDEDDCDDSTFIISQPKTPKKPIVSLLAKVKATKKLVVKEVKEPNISVPQKEKLNNAVVSSKPVKTEGTTKSTEVKKVYMPEKSPETKTSFTDDKEVAADSTFITSKKKIAKRVSVPVSSKTRKSNAYLRRKIKNTKNLIAKEIEKSDSAASPKEKLENTMDSSKHIISDDPPTSAEAKKVSTQDKRIDSKMHFTTDQEVPVDSTFTKSKKIIKKPRVPVPKRTKPKETNDSQEIERRTKMKNTEKLISKVLEDFNTSVSPNEKLENTMDSSNHVKFDDKPKSAEAKKVSTPDKRIDSKMHFTTDQEVPVDSIFTKSKKKIIKKPRVPVPKRTKPKESNDSQEIERRTKMKNTEKLIAKVLEEFNTSISPNKKMRIVMVSSKHIKAEGTNSEDAKKVSTPEKSIELKMIFTDDQEVQANSPFTNLEMKMAKKAVKKSRASLSTKSRKFNASLQAKNKEPKKLMAEVEGLNAPESPNRKHNNIMTTSKREKTNGVYKSVKTKKNAKTKQADSVKKVVTKNISIEDGQK